MDKRCLFSYALFTSSVLSFPIFAECISSPDCAALGYTKSETGCNGAPFVRCPFDTSKVVCLVKVSCSDSKDGLATNCNANEYHCTQQNFGGNICWKQGAALTCEEKLAKGLVGCCSNTNCSGKTYCDTGSKTCKSGCYQNSQCSTGYECNISTHACEENKTCAVGDIYYSNRTCSSEVISGKAPIGVVSKISNGGRNGVVVALDTASGMQWGCDGTDLSLTNYTSQSSALNDFSGEANTGVIAGNCGNNTAAYYCKNSYSKSGISGWYLPAYGELYAILYTDFSAINTGLSKISSNNQIAVGSSFWSSSEYSRSNALSVGSSSANWYNYGKRSSQKVRCVLAF